MKKTLVGLRIVEKCIIRIAEDVFACVPLNSYLDASITLKVCKETITIHELFARHIRKTRPLCYKAGNRLILPAAISSPIWGHRSVRLPKTYYYGRGYSHGYDNDLVETILIHAFLRTAEWHHLC